MPEIKFTIRKPVHWKPITFEDLLCCILENLGAERYEYDRRWPDSGVVIFNPKSPKDGRRIVTAYSDISATVWRFNCNRAKRRPHKEG